MHAIYRMRRPAPSQKCLSFPFCPAGIAEAKAEGKTWGGRRPGTRMKLTVEKEALIGQLHAEGTPIAAIARTVGLARNRVYRAIREDLSIEPATNPVDGLLP
jgi:DNA invertase Pin-like site-specific DNA recombinase